VEFKDQDYRYSENWHVADYDRLSAYEISKDQDGNPNYGGSVNDASLVRYLQELQKRGLKIMLYPMFFMDLPGKPWRGRLTGSAADISHFFNKEEGYNRFILHYANLTKDYVDAFIIGSELIGLTKIRQEHEQGPTFPAVNELINLALQVKQIMGKKVKISYAADWSEYHHTEGGWFNLDPLWTSEAIDFVGIDAYFPITETNSSIITEEEITKGFNSGHGYDYLIDRATGQKRPVKAEYAWKNIDHWWRNYHHNPDGGRSLWVPRCKPIWFTEFGFPSIDKATNQPNIFFDPKAIDGGAPKYSSGKADFTLQRQAIKAFIDYWGQQEFIGQMFLWTWDARPYPAWPCGKFWHDEYLWEKGHWVNYKFGISELGAIIQEISAKCGIEPQAIDTSSLCSAVSGFTLKSQVRAIDAIHMLRAAYFFDIKAMCQNVPLSFSNRAKSASVAFISAHNCALQANDNYFEHIILSKEQILAKIALHYHKHDHKPGFTYLDNGQNSYRKTACLYLPLILCERQAQIMAKRILQNAANEQAIIKFALPNTLVHFAAGDFVQLNLDDNGKKSLQLRIIEIASKGQLTQNITALIDNKDDYRNFYDALSSRSDQSIHASYQTLQEELYIFTLPWAANYKEAAGFFIALNAQQAMPLRSKLAIEPDNSWMQIAHINPSNNILAVQAFESCRTPCFMHVDNSSYIVVTSPLALDLGKNGTWQRALIGNEVIAFAKIEKLENQGLESNVYRLSQLMRGLYDTQSSSATSHKAKNMVLLDKYMHFVPLAKEAQASLVSNIDFSCGRSFASAPYQQDSAAKMILPYIKSQEMLPGQQLKLCVLLRSKHDLWQSYTPTEALEKNFLLEISAKDKVITQDLQGEGYILINLSGLDLSGGYYLRIIGKN
jgi:hypothetical protein